MSLYYDKLFSDVKKTVMVSAPNGTVFTGLMTDDFSSSNETSWNHNSLQKDGGIIQSLIDGAMSLTGATPKVMETVLGTVSEWTGQGKPSFDVKFDLVNTGSTGTDNLDILKNLLYLTSPTLSSGGGVYSAPGGYSVDGLKASIETATGMADAASNIYNEVSNSSGLAPTYVRQTIDDYSSNTDPANNQEVADYGGKAATFNSDAIRAQIRNTWTVRWGDYFQIGYLLCDSLRYTISKEWLSNGRPLYIQITLAFNLAYQPSAEDIQQWFLK